MEVQLLQQLSHTNLVSYRHVWLENVHLTSLFTALVLFYAHWHKLANVPLSLSLWSKCALCFYTTAGTAPLSTLQLMLSDISTAMLATSITMF